MYTGLPVRASVSLELYDTAHDAWALAGAATSDGSGNFGVQAVVPTISPPGFTPYQLSLLGTDRVTFRAQGYQLNLWKNSATYGEATPVVVSNWGAHGGINASLVPCQSSFDLGCG